MSGHESEGPGGGEGRVINLLSLGVAQLQNLKLNIEQELNFYQEAILSLKDVQIKMQEAGNSLKSLCPEKKQLLVPVTPSIFVRAEIEDTEHVLIDIGTGYYVQRTLEEGKDYFRRKVEFLTTQIEKVQFIGREKSTVRGAIVEILEGRLQEAQKKSPKE